MKSGYEELFQKRRRIDNPKSRDSIRVSTAASKSEQRLSSPSPRISLESVQKSVQARRQEQIDLRRKKRGIAWGPVLLCSFGAILTGMGLLYAPQVERWIKQIQIEVGIASPAVANADASSPSSGGTPVAEPSVPSASPSEVTASNESMSHLQKLAERKRQLDQREEEVTRMEAELAAQKAELEKKLAEIQQTRTSISNQLETRVQADEKKVGALVEMYSSMRPQQTAKVFEEIDDELAVQVLSRMKKKNAAEVMNLMKAERATQLSEKMAGFRRRSAARQPTQFNSNGSENLSSNQQPTTEKEE